MTRNIPIILRGSQEMLTVHYDVNTSPFESGFDALDVPFPKESCIGYPTLHAYFSHMKLTGYKRYCAFIQLVQRTEYPDNKQNLQVDVDSYFDRIGNPYFSYGYPASLYDAPCKNLGNCNELTWRAFTYLVDMPSRLNQYKLKALTGFTWGYKENAAGPIGLLDFDMLTEADFAVHYDFIIDRYPQLAKL